MTGFREIFYLNNRPAKFAFTFALVMLAISLILWVILG